MKIFKALAILLLTLLLLTSCCEELHDCKIVDKSYHQAYTTLIPVYNGKFFYYITQYHPERFTLIIEGLNEKEEVRRTYIDIAESTWNEVQIGQSWPVKEGS